MLIETGKFGKIEIDKQRIITFVEGLIGFSNLKRFVLIDNDEISPFRWLQAVDEPSLCFLTIDPIIFKSDYTVPITKEELYCLQTETLEGLLTIVIATVPNEARVITGNMKGPIIINPKNYLGKQLALIGEGFNTRHPIISQAKS